MGYGHQARLLDCVRSLEELGPGLGCALDTGLVQHCLVGPHPVDAVHIHRCSNVVALVFHDVSHHAGQQLVPLLGLGSGVQVGQHAFSSPLLQSRALDLGGSGRVAGHHAALQHGHGVVTAATSDCEIFPGMALALHDLLELAHRLGFTARSPPVQNFHFASHCSRAGNYQCHSGGEFRKLQHHVSQILRPSPETELRTALNPSQHHAGQDALIIH